MRPALPLMTVPSGSSQCLISSTTPSPAAGTPPPSLDLAPLPFTLFLILHSRPRRRALTFQPLSASYSLSLALSLSRSLALSLFSPFLSAHALICIARRQCVFGRAGWRELASSGPGWLGGELEGLVAWRVGGVDGARNFGPGVVGWRAGRRSHLRGLASSASSALFLFTLVHSSAAIHCCSHSLLSPNSLPAVFFVLPVTPLVPDITRSHQNFAPIYFLPFCPTRS